MIAFGGRRGPHRSGSRCRGRPIERREAGREGCLWPNAASQGRPPDGSGGESERSTQNGRAKTFGGGGGSNSELPQAGFPESGEKYGHTMATSGRAAAFCALRSYPHSHLKLRCVRIPTSRIPTGTRSSFESLQERERPDARTAKPPPDPPGGSSRDAAPQCARPPEDPPRTRAQCANIIFFAFFLWLALLVLLKPLPSLSSSAASIARCFALASARCGT